MGHIKAILMREEETGKLLRDEETGALQRYIVFGDDCGWCELGTTPYWIHLTVTGLEDCTECFAMAGSWWKAHGTSTRLAANHTLHQTVANTCIWEKIQTGGAFGTLDEYAAEGCAGGIINSYTLDKCQISVRKCEPQGIVVSIQVVATEWLPNYFTVFAYAGAAWNCKAAAISECINAGPLANDTVCGGGEYGRAICESGTVTIEEGPPPEPD